MIPLFVSDYSIGRSILTLSPNKNSGTSGILSLAQEAGLKEVYLIEDNMTSFLPAQKLFSKKGISLRYGVRFKVCNDVEEEDRKRSEYKVILFALNDAGCKELYHIFTEVNTSVPREGYLDEKLFRRLPHDNIGLMHPFYDSYLFHNTMYFKNCLHNGWTKDPYINEEYIVEDNGLPFDKLIRSKIDPVMNIIEAKTILYHYRKDIEAYQIYRIACNRSFGRARSLNNPDIPHMGSEEFSFQSYLERTNG